MARLKIAAAILAAAEKWKQRCLLKSGSLFAEERLWTSENFGELQTYFMERPDAGSDSFEEKLRRQLEPAPPEAKRLWAEITWLYYLIVKPVKRVNKLDRIKTAWEWSGAALPEDHWALGDVLDGGMIRTGTAYMVHQWREFKFIITMMLDWSSRSERERESLLNDPWGFAEWVDGQNDGRRRQFRHALLFLLFPDEFEDIVTLRYKKDIVKAFREEIGDTPDVDSMDLTELDKVLLAIRRRLEDKHPGEEINFYETPLKELWQDGSQTPNGDGRADGLDDEAWYQDRFGTADVWVIAPGEGARLWGDFLELGIAAIGWDDLGDLSEYDSREAIHSALIENGAGQNPYNQSLAAWEFVHDMKIGDILIAKRGRSAILGWGKVTGDYVYESERPEYQKLRTVEWYPCHAPINLNDPITTKALTRFTTDKKWLRYAFKLIDADAGTPEVGLVETENGLYGVDTALSDLFIEETQFSRILGSIALRKNLILQGPPGVGKTYIARRIAWCLVGRNDSRSIEMVQFHQSYAYEDFVQGWRPTETGGFTLRNGVFFEFCKRAEQQPETPFVFIIDEINRGNLSKIFGELLMLIEGDKRGPEHAIALTYGASEERFSVPDNVHLLGLMNTADRSLAIVDYALRRRFAFETLKPAYGTGKFREYLLEADVDPRLVDRIDRNLSALNEHIRGDKDLGPGFQVGHSYFVPEESADEQWYLDIVDTQIAPLLREYWFDRPERVDELVEKFAAVNDKKIPIANIYYLLCYAWGHVEEGDVVRLDELEGLERVHDLLGKVLAEGTFRLIRRGIDRGYREVREDLAGIRGKIAVGETVKRALRARGQAACDFEELSYDVLHNRILRSTLRSLLRLPDLHSDVRAEVRSAYTKLDGVSVVPLNRRLFQQVQLDRNRRYYRFLLSVCRLIHEQLLVNERSGEAAFTDFSEERMERLYEDFIIEFYRREQDRYRVNHRGRTIAWVDEGTPEHQRSKLPRMEADVILEAPDRRIIMDAKYYREALGGRYGGKLHSNNLYQLLTYLRNREATEAPGSRHEGILLYPTVEASVAVNVRLEGFSIRARTIDLAQDWRNIHDGMLALIT